MKQLVEKQRSDPASAASTRMLLKQLCENESAAQDISAEEEDLSEAPPHLLGKRFHPRILIDENEQEEDEELTQQDE